MRVRAKRRRCTRKLCVNEGNRVIMAMREREGPRSIAWPRHSRASTGRSDGRTAASLTTSASRSTSEDPVGDRHRAGCGLARALASAHPVPFVDDAPDHRLLHVRRIGQWVPKTWPTALASEFAQPTPGGEDLRCQGMALTFVYLIVRQLTEALTLLARSDIAKTAEILLLRRQVKPATRPGRGWRSRPATC
jgi:hypothetical protein